MKWDSMNCIRADKRIETNNIDIFSWLLLTPALCCLLDGFSFSFHGIFSTFSVLSIAFVDIFNRKLSYLPATYFQHKFKPTMRCFTSLQCKVMFILRIKTKVVQQQQKALMKNFWKVCLENSFWDSKKYSYKIEMYFEILQARIYGILNTLQISNTLHVKWTEFYWLNSKH